VTEDGAAVRLAREGDLDAYGVLVARYTAVAHRLAVLLGAGDDAQDVLQVAFMKAYDGLAGFREGAAFRPWLLRIVANETHNARRARGRRDGAHLRALTLAPVGPGPVEPAEAVVAAERRRDLLRAVAELPDRERLAVTYRYLMDLSEAETAAALGWPTGSVKSRLSRGLTRLQELLATTAGDDDGGRGGGARG